MANWAQAETRSTIHPRAEKKEDGTEQLKYSITLLIPKEPHKYQPTPDKEIEGFKKLAQEAAKAAGA